MIPTIDAVFLAATLRRLSITLARDQLRAEVTLLPEGVERLVRARAIVALNDVLALDE